MWCDPEELLFVASDIDLGLQGVNATIDSVALINHATHIRFRRVDVVASYGDIDAMEGVHYHAQ